MVRRTLVLCLVAAAALPAAAAGSSPPRVNQLVVFRDGTVKGNNGVRARQAVARVSGKRCAVPAGTPLAALVVSRVAKIGFRDYGSCSRRARDAGGLFVKSLGPDVNRGADGWVYKVGRKLGSADSADPSGPFGHGLLRSGSEVVWFYCHFTDGSCQRTLAFTRVAVAAGSVQVSVRAYDDRGRGVPAAGATVHVDAATALTGPDGSATVPALAGRHQLWVDQASRIPSFFRTVVVP
jgi:hypothetical protein